MEALLGAAGVLATLVILAGVFQLASPFVPEGPSPAARLFLRRQAPGAPGTDRRARTTSSGAHRSRPPKAGPPTCRVLRQPIGPHPPFIRRQAHSVHVDSSFGIQDARIRRIPKLETWIHPPKMRHNSPAKLPTRQRYRAERPDGSARRRTGPPESPP